MGSNDQRNAVTEFGDNTAKMGVPGMAMNQLSVNEIGVERNRDV
jgi:hypothetical protein